MCSRRSRRSTRSTLSSAFPFNKKGGFWVFSRRRFSINFYIFTRGFNSIQQIRDHLHSFRFFLHLASCILPSPHWLPIGYAPGTRIYFHTWRIILVLQFCSAFTFTSFKIPTITHRLISNQFCSGIFGYCRRLRLGIVIFFGFHSIHGLRHEFITARPLGFSYLLV